METISEPLYRELIDTARAYSDQFLICLTSAVDTWHKDPGDYRLISSHDANSYRGESLLPINTMSCNSNILRCRDGANIRFPPSSNRSCKRPKLNGDDASDDDDDDDDEGMDTNTGVPLCDYQGHT